MLVKLKYVGTGEEDIETDLTTNGIYVALAIVQSGQSGNTPSAVILNDSGVPYVTHDISQPLWWELVSVEAVANVQIFP